MDSAEIVAIAGRSEASRGKALAREFAVPFVVGVKKLIEARPESRHRAAFARRVRDTPRRCSQTASPSSCSRAGAVRRRAASAPRARRGETRRAALPSLGGIGGLDALKAACAAGVDE